MIARQGNQRYFIHTFLVSWLCNYCTNCKIDKKLSRNNTKLSRRKIGEWFDNHPKKQWWILNTRVADYCMITADKKSHNTTVLGKYLPRKQTSWQLEAGLSSVNMNASRVLINFERVSPDYLFVIIWLCLFDLICLIDGFSFGFLWINYWINLFACFSWFICVCAFDCFIHSITITLTAGVGVWDWGTRVKFFRFPLLYPLT